MSVKRFEYGEWLAEELFKDAAFLKGADCVIKFVVLSHPWHIALTVLYKEEILPGGRCPKTGLINQLGFDGATHGVLFDLLIRGVLLDVSRPP